MQTRFVELQRDAERGAVAGEYAIMLALIGATLVAALVVFRGQIIGAIQRVGTAVDTVGT